MPGMANPAINWECLKPASAGINPTSHRKGMALARKIVRAEPASRILPQHLGAHEIAVGDDQVDRDVPQGLSRREGGIGELPEVGEEVRHRNQDRPRQQKGDDTGQDKLLDHQPGVEAPADGQEQEGRRPCHQAELKVTHAGYDGQCGGDRQEQR